MRAEMTVGLDLTSLENLKIFNGHEVVKKEPIQRIDSSPDLGPVDNDSDDQQQQLQQTNKKGRQKYGRPANPIPRHKRDSHIKAEYKRRDKIQKGFDSLVSLVPELRDSNVNKESKSSMLFKAAEYCRRLKGESGNMQSEMEALRQELEALGTEIHDLQSRLPQQGLDVTEKDPVKMDALYDKYVAEETKKNWKFWIFGFFLGPLYQSYRQAMSSVTRRQEFTSSVGEWTQETLSLTNLRKGFFEALRKISIQTGIMMEPDKLEEEAKQSSSIHYIKNTLPDKPKPAPAQPEPSSSKKYEPKPQALPTQRKPKSEGTTPERSPTIPRRPVTQIRSIKRDSRKSKESRSRSTTPPAEETKQKRRSSHHRTDRRGEQEDSHSGRSSQAPSPRAYSVELPFNKPFLSQTSPPHVTAATFSSTGAQTKFVPVLIPQEQVNVSQQEVVSTLRSLLQECSPSFKTLAPNPSIIIPRIVPSTQVQSSYSSVSFPISQSNNPIGVSAASVPMEGVDTHPQGPSISIYNPAPHQSFTPICQSSIITNTGLLPLSNRHIRDPAPTLSIDSQPSLEDSYTPVTLPDLQSLLSDHSMSYQSSTSLDQLTATVFTTAQPTVLSAPSTISLPVLSHSQVEPMSINTESEKVAESAHFMNQDEDSLMKMLSVDVMDINSVMTFFDNDQAVTMSTDQINKPS